MDKEEGEMSDDNAMIVDDVTSPIEDNINCTIVSKLNLVLMPLFWYVFVI